MMEEMQILRLDIEKASNSGLEDQGRSHELRSEQLLCKIPRAWHPAYPPSEGSEIRGEVTWELQIGPCGGNAEGGNKRGCGDRWGQISRVAPRDKSSSAKARGSG